MRIRHALLALVITPIIAPIGYGQGTFQDLNFEGANIVPISGPREGFAVTVANALPGWTVDYGNTPQTQIYYNSPALGSAEVNLSAKGYPGYVGGTIDGNFSLLLEAGSFDGVSSSSSISQTGQIPTGSESLLFESVGFGNGPSVSIGNDSLTLFPVGSGIGNGINYTIYGANVSAWAGQTEPLTFTCSGAPFVIDDISFSPSAVPEPNPLFLTTIGGVLFAIYRHFAPKRR
jgi:hypothetical protein